jgi:hypothetical protein
MFKRPELSRLVESKTQIIVHCFQDNMINPGKYIVDKAKYNADIAATCDLFFNGEKIGKYISQVNQEDQKSIYLYFHKLQDMNLDYTYAALDIDCNTIQCPSCKAFYRVGDSPCECIKLAAFFYLSEAKVSSVNLFDYRYHNIDTCDYRERLYAKFFGGSLRNLKIMDPL